MANDPEYAEWVLSLPAASPSGPPLSEWTPEVERLTAIIDRLGEVIAAVIGAAGGKPPKVTPSPRPLTAIDRARSNVRHRRHLQLVEEVRQAQIRYSQQEG